MAGIISDNVGRSSGLLKAASGGSSGISFTENVAEDTSMAMTFTGIPAGTKEVCIHFLDLSLDSSDNIDIQIGDSGGLETSGYLSEGSSIIQSTFSSLESTSSFVIKLGSHPARLCGAYILRLINTSTNKWAGHYVTSGTGAPSLCGGGGFKALSGELTQLEVQSTNSRDAGAVTISFKG